MNRHEYRVNTVISVYQHLLLKKDMIECFLDNFEEDDNEYVNSIKFDLIDHKQDYIDLISPHLNKWTFDRLSYIDQAILLVACSEYKQGLIEKNIIIDEAIRIAKQYSEEDSYKYINGVLDNL